MKYSYPFLRSITTLAPALVACSLLAGACSDDDPTTPPTPPPMMDASPMPDQSTTPDVQMPPPAMDAGGITCGMNTCTSRIVGGQIGLPCCAMQGTTCGLNFGQGCINQGDAGFTPPTPGDAGTITPDPSCGELPITVMNTMLTLSGCCLSDGMCGYYSPQSPGLGCASLAQLRGFGIPVPDASKACGDGGTSVPDSGNPPDAGDPPDSGNPPDTGTPDDGGGQDGAGDTATPDAIAPDTGTPGDGSSPPDGASDDATPPSDGASSDTGTG
jgi:hypothetical protein